MKDIPHPNFGEEADTHDYEVEHKGKKVNTGKLTFALVGNQNCGKTTLFNQLTGSNQHVGNFPGVTVDRKSGSIKGYPDTEVVDLPGIYSMSPYTSEEIVSRKFILEEKPYDAAFRARYPNGHCTQYDGRDGGQRRRC